MKCSVDDCSSSVLARGWCSKHYQRWAAHGDLTARPQRPRGSGSINRHGYIVIGRGNRHAFLHVLIAENALGRKLPDRALVHHVDGNPSNNNPSNLVICPDDAYHKLLHTRLRALEASGNPDYLKCQYCKEYDAPSNLQKHARNTFVHRNCYNKYKRDLRARKKQNDQG